MVEELEPGAADPAALSQLQTNSPGGDGAESRPRPAPESPDEPSIGGEPASKFVERRQNEADFDELREIMMDPSRSLREKADARELMLSACNMGKPIEEKATPEEQETLWTGAVTVPDDLGPPLPAGDFSEMAPKNEAELEDTLGTVMETNPKFSGWFNQASEEQQVTAVSALRELASAGVPASLLSDLTKMEHEAGQFAQHFDAEACKFSLVSGHGVEGAKRKLKQANAVINSLPDGVRERYQAGLAQTGLGNYAKLIERLSDFYERGK